MFLINMNLSRLAKGVNVSTKNKINILLNGSMDPLFHDMFAEDGTDYPEGPCTRCVIVGIVDS